MSDNPAQKSATKKDGKSRLSLILIILLLLILAGGLIFFIPKMKEYKAMLAEREAQKVELQQNLENLLAEHDSVKTQYGALSDSLLIRDSIIQANAEEIKQLLNYKWEYYKIDKKFKLLQNIAQDYVIRLDSLYTANRELHEENDRIKQQIENEKQISQNLMEEKEELIQVVEEAAVLQTYNLTATPLKIVGRKRTEKPTDKADRVENIKICFTLSANDLVEKGKKQVYLRIARPDNEIITQMTTDDYTFEYQGQLIQYTAMKEVDYQNESIDLCMYWRKRTKSIPAMEGVYNVYLFCDGAEIGHTTFELK